MRITRTGRERLRTAAVVLGVAAVQWGGAVVPALSVPAAFAQERHYPQGMTAAERRRYYDAYNASRTPAQWDSIRRATAAARIATGPADRGVAAAGAAPVAVTSRAEPPRAGNAGPSAPAAVVSFRVRNRGLRPTKVEVAGNVLDFGPYETRYVQFPPESRIYAYDARRPGGRGRLLFTVTRADEGRAYGVRR